MLSGISVAYNLITYILGPSYFFSPWSLLSLVAIFGLLTYLTIQIRKEEGGFMTYSNAFMLLVISYAAMSVVYFLYTYILYNFVDVTLTEKQFEYSKDAAIKMMEKFNTPDDAMEEALAKMDADKDPDQFGLLGIAKMFVISSVIVSGLVNALLALIVRKKRPEFN